MKVGSDFSGVGAFDQALRRLGVNYETVFACDMDKYARDTFIHNYGEPKYYPTNVYDREIPSESLDIYMTSPPCQAFSLAGKRLGKDDKRGILFFNSHEFIQVNKPRFFIFENVKGLLSDDGGKTFQEWINMLGGKSVNGLPVLFPHDDAVPYHLYWKVLNAKHHGVPQNRERVFLIGIRDDADNQFQFPKDEHLSKRLKDVLEDEVDYKYFKSLLDGETFSYEKNGNVECVLKGGRWDKIHEQARRIYNKECEAPTIHTMGGGNLEPKIIETQRIRRLTPRECFRLMDFPDTFTWNVSDSQAYKQAGNSIVVNVLYKILKQLPL